MNLYTAETWPHLDMLDKGWVVCGDVAIRVEDIGMRQGTDPVMERFRSYCATIHVYQDQDRWDLWDTQATDKPPRPWLISVLPYRTMATRYIYGFATEADARIIADRILAASGAWDASTEGTGADGE